MKPEEYKNLVLGITEKDEGARILQGLVYLLKEYASEEALTKNFVALQGEGKEEECKDLLKTLHHKRVFGIGPYDEYICPAGHEKDFEEIALDYLKAQPKLSAIVKAEVDAGNNAALTMIELMLKMSTHGLPGVTQYEFIKADISDMFSPEVFQALETDFIAKNLCVYGQRAPRHEFLWLYHQTDDERKAAQDMLIEFREKELYKMTRIKEFERLIGEVIAESQQEQKAKKEGLDHWAAFSQEQVDAVSAHFSGFTMDEDFVVLNGNLYVDRDTLHLVITDKLSRYVIREWKDQPVVFVTEKLPKCVQNLSRVFEEAYPCYEERKLAIVVPNEVAYANFDQKLFSRLIARLGIEKCLEF
ncbi:MAG: hypothetical protein C5S38_01535 [Candidatus Methanophagaceae archaeon]|nr:MAG: hypothetical protein C5S38_01535 [Methanophagales archaeon]